MVHTVKDYMLAVNTAAKVGVSIGKPTKPAVSVNVPVELSRLAATLGLRLQVVDGFGAAGVRVHLPGGAGHYEARGCSPNKVLTELRAILADLT